MNHLESYAKEAEYTLEERFGSDSSLVIVTPFESQLIVAFPKPTVNLAMKKENRRQFTSIYMKLAPPRTELSLERDVIGAMQIPFDVETFQDRIKVSNPALNWPPLSHFDSSRDQSSLDEEYDEHIYRKLCFEKMVKSLEKRKPYAWTKKKEKCPDSMQKNLFQYFEGGRQFTLSDFDSLKYKPNVRSYIQRTIIPDTIYCLHRKIDTNMLAEVKLKPSLTPYAIDISASQLIAYSLALEIFGDRKIPIGYIHPSVLSHTECEMIERIERELDREIVPISITTTDHLIHSIKNRIDSCEFAIENSHKLGLIDSRKKFEINIELYRREIEHLNRVSIDLRRDVL